MSTPSSLFSFDYVIEFIPDDDPTILSSIVIAMQLAEKRTPKVMAVEKINPNGSVTVAFITQKLAMAMVKQLKTMEPALGHVTAKWIAKP